MTFGGYGAQKMPLRSVLATGNPALRSSCRLSSHRTCEILEVHCGELVTVQTRPSRRTRLSYSNSDDRLTQIRNERHAYAQPARPTCARVDTTMNRRPQGASRSCHTVGARDCCE